MTRTKSLLMLAALAALAGCGKVQQLRPDEGHVLPVKPATAPVQPSAAQLLTPPPAYRPGRSDELLTKSSTRPDDHFDLPPH